MDKNCKIITGPGLSSDFWKDTERNRAISLFRFFNMFKTMGLMESCLDALLGFRLQSSFMTW